LPFIQVIRIFYNSTSREHLRLPWRYIEPSILSDLRDLIVIPVGATSAAVAPTGIAST